MNHRMDDKANIYWIISGILCVLFFMSRWFHPDFLGNESIYSVHPLKLLNPDYLKNDPFMGNISYFTLFYSLVVSPFFALFDPLVATMITRVLIWSFQTWALIRLCKTLGLKWWSFLIFIVLLVDVPSKIAGEWVIESAASKPIAYGFVFLSLEALLKGQYKKSGAFSGASISFHILSGGWSAIALFFSVLTCSYREKRLRPAYNFALFSFLFSLPGLIPSFYRLFTTTSAPALQQVYTESVDNVSVLFANPHHLDPAFFLSGPEAIKLAIIFILPFILYGLFLNKNHLKILFAFLLPLVLFFLSGLVARKFDLFGYLKYYPFRVADGLLPLNLWLGVGLMIQTLLKNQRFQVIISFILVPFIIMASTFLIDLTEATKQYSSFKDLFKNPEPRLTAYLSKDTILRLYNYFGKSEYSDFDQIAFWVEKNTGTDSLFITPPWEHSFALVARRPQLVTYKCRPIGKKLLSWKERMEDLNGGEFTREGKGWLFSNLKKNYPKLSENEIIALQKKYGADYIITTEKNYRDFDIILSNKTYTLYKISDRG